MTKKEMIEKVADAVGMSKASVQSVIENYENALVETVKDGGAYRISEFGTFSLAERAERNGHNPATGEKMVIPAKKYVKFKTSSKFLD